MMHGLTDIHAHILWGLDDGPESPEGMYRLLREAHNQGIVRLAATPHVCPGYVPFDAGRYRERLDEARAYCSARRLNVEILAGAEVAWTYQTVDALRRGAVPTLGGTDYVLLELWHDISLQEAYDAVRSVRTAGYHPVLAHVERYSCFAWMPRYALRFREETGALFQADAEALLQPRGFGEKRFISRMLREQALDAVASDAHGGARPLNLRPAYEWLLGHTDEQYARRLTTFPYE